ncbi:MAG: cyclodeaminase/cyclohydrolase family protein [Clostridiales bacterium]|nr:cyclodeaminase/cyclohydrolase family protein [Clostridiales bacterium]
MKDMTVTQLCDLTASNSPAPGGGSISAMAAAYAGALVCMVAKLTLGKKGYEDVQDEMAEMDQEADAMRQVLLSDIQKDSESFNGFMVALAMPKDTEEEKALRSQAMQDALKGACAVPYEVAGKALRMLQLAVDAVTKGNLNTASDGMVGVLMGRAGVIGALNNVRINLRGVKDEAFKQDMMSKCDVLEETANRLEAQAQKALHARE